MTVKCKTHSGISMSLRCTSARQGVTAMIATDGLQSVDSINSFDRSSESDFKRTWARDGRGLGRFLGWVAIFWVVGFEKSDSRPSLLGPIHNAALIWFGGWRYSKRGLRLMYSWVLSVNYAKYLRYTYYCCRYYLTIDSGSWYANWRRKENSVQSVSAKKLCDARMAVVSTFQHHHRVKFSSHQQNVVDTKYNWSGRILVAIYKLAYPIIQRMPSSPWAKWSVAKGQTVAIGLSPCTALSKGGMHMSIEHRTRWQKNVLITIILYIGKNLN
jgi:hypothetical protein